MSEHEGTRDLIKVMLTSEGGLNKLLDWHEAEIKSHELAAYKRMAEEIKNIYNKPGVEYTFNGIAIRDDIDQALDRLSKEVGK